MLARLGGRVFPQANPCKVHFDPRPRRALRVDLGIERELFKQDPDLPQAEKPDLQNREQIEQNQPDRRTARGRQHAEIKLGERQAIP